MVYCQSRSRGLHSASLVAVPSGVFKGFTVDVGKGIGLRVSAFHHVVFSI